MEWPKEIIDKSKKTFTFTSPKYASIVAELIDGVFQGWTDRTWPVFIEQNENELEVRVPPGVYTYMEKISDLIDSLPEGLADLENEKYRTIMGMRAAGCRIVIDNGNNDHKKDEQPDVEKVEAEQSESEEVESEAA